MVDPFFDGGINPRSGPPPSIKTVVHDVPHGTVPVHAELCFSGVHETTASDFEIQAFKDGGG